MIKKCLFCEKDIIKKKTESMARLSNRKFCSHKCRANGNPTSYWLGKKLSGNRKVGWKHSEDKNKEKSERQKGHTVSLETRLKISEAQKGKPRKTSGKNHPNWRGGVTSENHRIRTSIEYKEWRKSVFERDGYSCKECGAKSSVGNKIVLNADHIKPFATYPELRLSVDNGRTLCAPCHRKTDTWGVNRKYLLEITKS